MENHYSKKIKFKIKDREKNSTSRWQLYNHYNKGNLYIRHKQGQKRLNAEYKLYQVRKRREIESLIDDSFTIDTYDQVNKDNKIFQDGGIEKTKFIDKNHAFKEKDVDEEYFKKYHKDYDNFKKDWDIVPIDQVISYLRQKFSLNTDSFDSSDEETKSSALVRIADFGCGYGKLHESIGHFSNLSIDSYDLIAMKDFIIEADYTHIPSVKNFTYDIIVCCLSMMSSINKKINEIKRVLKNKGELIIWQPNSTVEYIIEILELNNFNILKKIKTEKFTNLICQKS